MADKYAPLAIMAKAPDQLMQHQATANLSMRCYTLIRITYPTIGLQIKQRGGSTTPVIALIDPSSSDIQSLMAHLYQAELEANLVCVTVVPNKTHTYTNGINFGSVGTLSVGRESRE